MNGMLESDVEHADHVNAVVPSGGALFSTLLRPTFGGPTEPVRSGDTCYIGPTLGLMFLNYGDMKQYARVQRAYKVKKASLGSPFLDLRPRQDVLDRPFHQPPTAHRRSSHD